MFSPSHLHFRTLSPEARHSALQRLVWRGLDPRTISERTGLAEVEVRRVIEANASSSPRGSRLESHGSLGNPGAGRRATERRANDSCIPKGNRLQVYRA